jgi:hypothetical protein
MSTNPRRFDDVFQVRRAIVSDMEAVAAVLRDSFLELRPRFDFSDLNLDMGFETATSQKLERSSGPS